MNVPDIDLTKSQIYSLSNETKDKIKGIDKEIDILLINMQNYDYVTEYADKYVAENQNIKIERIDNLASRTDIMSKYNMESSDSGIVVKCGEKEKRENNRIYFFYVSVLLWLMPKRMYILETNN